jgi:autotransporter-associated beta strand protein
LELLEGRLAPATHTWTGASSTSSDWSDAANWTGGAPASAEANAVLIFPAAARRQNTDDIANLTVLSIAFTDNDYVIGGNQSITLTGGITDSPSAMGSNTFNVNLNVNDVQEFTVTENSTLRLGGVISGPGGVSKSGTGRGILVLAGVNTYQGPTRVSYGTLRMGVDNALPTTTALTVGGGFGDMVFDLNNFNSTVGSLDGYYGSVRFGDGGRANLTVGTNNTSTLFNGLFSGNGGLTKVGAGTLTTAVCNVSIPGQTNVTGGILRLLCGSLSGGGISIASGAAFEAAAGTTVNSLAGAGDLSLATGSLTINVAAGQTRAC